jgi:hypothetical protein
MFQQKHQLPILPLLLWYSYFLMVVRLFCISISILCILLVAILYIYFYSNHTVLILQVVLGLQLQEGIAPLLAAGHPWGSRELVVWPEMLGQPYALLWGWWIADARDCKFGHRGRFPPLLYTFSLYHHLKFGFYINNKYQRFIYSKLLHLLEKIKCHTNLYITKEYYDLMLAMY